MCSCEQENLCYCAGLIYDSEDGSEPDLETTHITTLKLGSRRLRLFVSTGLVRNLCVAGAVSNPALLERMNFEQFICS